VVTNHAGEPFILNSLTDDQFGDLDGQGDCLLPQTIAAGGSHTCTITEFLASDTLAPQPTSSRPPGPTSSSIRTRPGTMRP
jgi:hypothetical protein